MANKLIGFAAVALVLAAGAALAEQERDRGRDQRDHPEARHEEPHPGPHGYQRIEEPHGWNERPGTVDRDAYQHNFQAARNYRIGPYHRPPGWRDHHWVYGEHLPRAYWADQYRIGDYWLFGLEVPPAGFEWVRVGGDALLVNIGNGEVLQSVYGVFG